MKIAFVTYFPKKPLFPRGGVEAVSVALATALARLNDIELHAVTVDRTPGDTEIEQWRGVTVHRLHAAHGRSLLAYATGKGRRQIHEYIRGLKPDIIHAHDTYGLMVSGLEYPRILTIHGFIYEDTLYAGGWVSRIRSLLWKHYELASWADYPHIISITPYVRERLRGLSHGMIHDIENPVSEECFQIKPQPRKGTIFSAAIMNRRKNTVGLLKAFSQLLKNGSQAELRIAGSQAEPDYEREVRECINAHALNEKVKLLGKIGAEQLRGELAQASIFALASLEEGAPMVIAEAMAAGVPVVASNRCGIPYMVRDGETGFLVDPCNPMDIAWRLEQILNDDALRISFGKKAHEIALERFHPNQVARRTHEVYARLAREKRA